MPVRPPVRADPRPRDEASTHVLEAILLALILLSAAWTVTTMREPAVEPERPRANLERLAHDALVVLDGLKEERGSLLDLYLVEAMQCASSAPPSDGCEGARSTNLSMKLDNYLPRGAGYAIAIDNGVEPRDIYRSVLPAAETVSTDLAYAPSWNLTFLATELSCYESGMDVNVSLAPLRNGAHASATAVRANWSAANVSAVASHVAGVWNATLPGSTRPAATVVAANVTASGSTTYRGATSYASCDLAGAGPAIVSALRATSFEASTPTAPLGSRVTFSADLSDLLAVLGATVGTAEIVVYEPLPAHGLDPDSYVPAASLPLPVAAATEAEWDVSEESLFGVHPVVMTVQLQVGAQTVEARKLGFVSVALPSGVVPHDPPYRAVLQAWFPEW